MKFSISYTIRAAQHTPTGVVQRKVLVVRVVDKRERALQLAAEVGQHSDNVTLLRGERPLFSQSFFKNAGMKPRIIPSPTFAMNIYRGR